MQGVSFTSLWLVCGIFTASAVPTDNADISPNSVLTSYGLNVSQTLPIGNVGFTCQILQTLFPRNDTFSANSTYYTNLYEVPWSHTCRLEPACIMTPNTADDLSKIITIFRVLKTKFAIRSGGHSPNPGFSSVGSDGVRLSLQNLNGVAISKDKKDMIIAAGNRWRAVYTYAAGNGVSIVDGRERMVGVGEFLLGGGLSLFYNTYGLGMYQIVRYQVVLTNGEIVNATPTQNTDLYRALKGGLTNFGIVTEFEVLTNNYTKIYYEIYLYSPASTLALLEAYGNYLADPKIDTNSNIELDITPTYALAFLGYNGHANRHAIFDPFYKIPTSSTFFKPTNGTVNDVIFGVDGNAVSVGSTYEATYSHKVVDGKFMIEGYNIYLEYNKLLHPGMTFYYVPQGITPNLVAQGRALNGGNTLRLEATPQAWVDVYIDFNNPADYSLAESVVDAFIANITFNATAQNLSLPYLYANNAADKQRPLRGYEEQKFKILKEFAGKYDSLSVMQKLRNDGFLVSNE